MRNDVSGTVRLSEYRPPTHLVDEVELTFRLDPAATRVISRIGFRPNPSGAPDGRLWLDGEGLTRVSASVDGAPAEIEEGPGGIAVAVPGAPFTWEAEVEIAPEANTALEGLYISRGLYCTQCEAEGFRRITYYPDRPDVMAPFRVRMEGPGVLLSNGNKAAEGPGWAEWHDPWPKPAYLFALVAGTLVARSDRFTTASGRDVALNVWVRPGDADRAAYALDALIRAMRWDEAEYGREYDLDVFNIVAVDDFNAGAMENKGLNIFNAAYVLASAETATDRDYEMIESVVAHEYFHNWTGNRITCRDWFQLCLKEGLTVYRDQGFTAHERSAPVKRIEDALVLRSRQFREDAGPLAHPVRPEAYREIDNFYTATVYEKGAEVVGMLRRLVGEAAWERGLALYFDRHDGQAVTVEDWLACFAEASARDLSQFMLWYSQAGTPRIAVDETWEDGRYTLTLRQTVPPTPGQPDKRPMAIPVAVGLLSPAGEEVAPTQVVELTRASQTVTWDGLEDRPVPSILRGFSAPVIVQRTAPVAERTLLLAHDTDPFNRWEAARTLARETLMAMAADGAASDPAYLAALVKAATDERLDPAFRALVLSQPGQDDIAQALHEAGRTPDPDAIWEAAQALADAVAAELGDAARTLFAAMSVPGPYRPDARDAGRRALRGTILRLLTRRDDGATAAMSFAEAADMTTSLGALGALLSIGAGEDEARIFAHRWTDEPLVMDKWFALRIGHARPEEAALLAERLTEHPAFEWRNPNRFRAVLGSLARNHAGFHHASGAGYGLLADWLIRLDPVNPQTAARGATAFETWRRYDSTRRDAAQAALRRLHDRKDVSPELAEIVDRILAPADA